MTDRKASIATKQHTSRAYRTMAKFNIAMQAEGLPSGVHQFKFHYKRRWAFDLCWPAAMVAVELQGGGWSGGRHHRGAGSQADYERAIMAAAAGWTVLPVTAALIKEERIVAVLVRIIRERLPVPAEPKKRKKTG